MDALEALELQRERDLLEHIQTVEALAALQRCYTAECQARATDVQVLAEEVGAGHWALAFALWNRYLAAVVLFVVTEAAVVVAIVIAFMMLLLLSFDVVLTALSL